MQKQLFPELGIAPELLRAIESLGYEQPSPIQAEAIPVALAGHDLVGQSQTGSGKTMAFGVPAVQRVDTSIRAVQVLILCPTRELAIQVCAEIHKLTGFKEGLRVTPVYGGTSYDRQVRALQQGAHVVIGTPGRVLDLAGRGMLRLDQLKVLVFDEADEMLDMGFRDDIDRLMEKVPETRQTIFFSATLAPAIRELINRYTRDPKTITIEHKALTVPTVDQSYYEVQGRSKVEVLCRVLDIEAPRLAIIFANTKRAVDDVTDELVARGFTADRLHGDLNQMMRDRVMRNFRNATIEVLVATDVAARGLDVEEVDLILNFDLPYDEEDYVHRIGRTGRAGRTGKAVSLIAGREMFRLGRIQRYINTRIERAKIPSQEEVENKRIDQFFEQLKTTLESGKFESHEHTIERLLNAGHSSTDIASALIHLIMDTASRPAEPIVEDRRQERPARREREERAPRERAPERRAEERQRESESAPRQEAPASPRTERTERPQREERPRQEPVERERFAPEPARRERPEPARAERERFGPRPVMVRLMLNIGSSEQVGPADIAGVIYNAAGLPKGSVGSIKIFDKRSFVEVPEHLVEQAINGLGEAKMRGRPVRLAHDTSNDGSTFERPRFDRSRRPGGFGDDQKRSFDKKPYEKKPYEKRPAGKRGFEQRGFDRKSPPQRKKPGSPESSGGNWYEKAPHRKGKKKKRS